MANLNNEQLIALNDDLKAKIKDVESVKDAEIKRLEGVISSNTDKAIAELKDKDAEIQKLKDQLTAKGVDPKIAKLQAELDHANEVITELNVSNNKLVLQKQFKTELPIVSVDGVKYLLTSGAPNIPGIGVVAAEDIEDDSKAANAILAIKGQGIMVAIENTEE